MVQPVCASQAITREICTYVLSTEHSLVTKSSDPSRDQALGLGSWLYMEEHSAECAGEVQ